MLTMNKDFLLQLDNGSKNQVAQLTVLRHCPVPQAQQIQIIPR